MIYDNSMSENMWLLVILYSTDMEVAQYSLIGFGAHCTGSKAMPDTINWLKSHAQENHRPRGLCVNNSVV